MKVTAISGFRGVSSNNFTPKKEAQINNKTAENKQNNNVLFDKNYSCLMVNTKSTFKAGTPKDLVDLVQLVPLEDKLASLFPKFRRGDMIIVASEISEAQKLLKESVKKFEDIIKKFIFVKEPDFKGCLVFTKNANGLKEVWNINKEPIVLNDFDFLKTGEGYYVAQGDVLTFKEQPVVIKERPSGNNPLRPNNIGAFSHLFSKTFDFSKDAEACVVRQNKKNIQQLQKSSKIGQRKCTFADVGGQDEIIDHLKKSILYPIKYPQVYEGFPINHGTILYGPPGTGKSLIAEAIANETEATYKKLNGLELESKWVGESEENWRNLFEEAIENQPSIVFIDEFDAVARVRSGQNEYGDKVVNQILTLMSDLEKSGDDVFIIAATNKYEALDPAVTRPGRFGHHLEVKAPDLKGTRQILSIHAAKRPIAKNVDMEDIAEKMFERKMTGADIAAIVTTAHTNAFERAGIYEKMENGTLTPADMKKFKITMADFEKAIENHKQKAERKPIGFNKNK